MEVTSQKDEEKQFVSTFLINEKNGLYRKSSTSWKLKN